MDVEDFFCTSVSIVIIGAEAKSICGAAGRILLVRDPSVGESLRVLKVSPFKVSQTFSSYSYELLK